MMDRATEFRLDWMVPYLKTGSGSFSFLVASIFKVIMFLIQQIFNVLVIQTLATSMRINFHLTESICMRDQHEENHCLRIPTRYDQINDPLHIITYCLRECSNDSIVNQTEIDSPSWTFSQLAKQQVTSEQLYLWSAPVALIENYQEYLNGGRDADSNESIRKNIFYNCTWPRFGPFCQYSFDQRSLSSKSHLSLIDVVYDHHATLSYPPKTLTCYEHLICHRGPEPACLDWTEICDGRIDCHDGGQDEEHCWKLEVNRCEENEFKCNNGQCIPNVFYNDYPSSPDCLDGSDEPPAFLSNRIHCPGAIPTVNCEDSACSDSYNRLSRSLTSSCSHGRDQILIDAVMNDRPDELSNQCWTAFLCTLGISLSVPSCYQYCIEHSCEQVIRDNCSTSFFVLPQTPIIYSHLYFVFTKDDLLQNGLAKTPKYLCMNKQFCTVLSVNHHSIEFNNTICYPVDSIPIIYEYRPWNSWRENFFTPTLERVRPCAALPETYFNYCQHHHLYQCLNSSKCISPHRLLDGFRDCFFGDDEQMNYVSQFIKLEGHKDFFHCSSGNTYISRRLVGNTICDCPQKNNEPCDEEYSDQRYSQTHLSFQTICDGFTELKPLTIDGKSMTDETDCQDWLCDNIYTRCDGFWNCFDGKDEVGCNTLTPINCSTDHRPCIKTENQTLICLPISKFNDGHVDCIGGIDERKLCRSDNYSYRRDKFFCQNDTKFRCLDFLIVCDNRAYCAHGDDEQFCQQPDGDKLKDYMFRQYVTANKELIVHFSLLDRLTQQQKPEQQPSSTSLSKRQFIPNFQSYNNQCHRGLNLQVWLPSSSSSSIDNTTRIACLCPSSFYGPQCQFQRQRISLILQFRALSDAWQTPFIIVLFLIDNTQQRSIHSAEQMTYLPVRDCQVKFHLNLLFSNRTRDSSLTYSIHLDVYEQPSHHHRASYLIPVLFSFLPVYRVALQLDIPRTLDQDQANHYICNDLKCGEHGRCLRYAHVYHSSSSTKLPTSFCQCDQGWSGRYCTIRKPCSCSPQAHCLCPPERFGPRCYLSNNYICQVNSTYSPCLNGGRCIPNDEYQQETRAAYTCLCQKGFTGNRCQHTQTQLVVSFHPKLIDRLSQSMLVHFIQSHHNRRHEYGTTFKLIPFNFSSVPIYWSHPFHLVFLEFHHRQYYLLLLRPIFNRSESIIKKTIQSSDRCPHIRELLPSTTFNAHRLKRIKSYHLLCQPSQSPKVSCFYDDDHLCLCQTTSSREHREANCFEYDHSRKFDCLGRNACENDGQCFQDDLSCPQTSVCICAECFYGRRCQFSMDGFRLSLDAILGYHIQPSVSLGQQPSIVHLGLSFTILISVIGIVNSFLVLMTFKNTKLRQVGCGFYLLTSSITTFLTMVFFMMKSFVLMTSQMGSLTDHSFLLNECRSIDYLLRVCLQMDQWLNACVSLERAMTTVQGVNFNKLRSQKQAKYVVLVLLLVTSGSNVYDPIYRRLINEKLNSINDEDRLWCVVSYPEWLRTFDLIVQLCHFNIPFLINIISASTIIWQSARSRRKAQGTISFRAALIEQLRQHKHILIAPLVIVTLSVPRLILAVVSGCMKSNSQSKIYLAGYFISFAPSMCSFVIFVLPSKLYRGEFQQSMQQLRNVTQIPYDLVHRFVTTRK